MERSFKKILSGYHTFREKYAEGDSSVMEGLALHGQKPKIMIVSCCDSRVDPALILQCAPGELFIARNVANIVPPYTKDISHHGTSSALEFGVCFLEVKHLIILGHSQCGGIKARVHKKELPKNDFITSWVSIIRMKRVAKATLDQYAQSALLNSKKNCMTFPWIKKRVENNELAIHLWFFDIKTGKILAYDDESTDYVPLDVTAD